MAIVRQIPCPKCGNWTAVLADCQDCGVRLGKPTALQLKAAADSSDTNLAAIRAEQLRKAEDCDLLSDEQLAEWFKVQYETVLAREERLGLALERNLDQLDGDSDPRWTKWYQLNARYFYVSDTLGLLRERNHVLVCPNHGIGFPTTWSVLDSPAAPEPEQYEGLSLRGLLTGEGILAWERYCEACASGQIEQAAQRLLHAQQATGTPKRATVAR